MSVHGNLLFMSVEQTRGRVDCGTQGVDDTGQRRALPRRPHLRHQRHQASRSRSPPCRPAAARTRTRWSIDPKDTANLYIYGSGTEHGRVRARSSPAAPDGDPKDDPNTALFSIDVIQVPLAAPEKARDRQPAAHLRRPGDRRDRRPVAGRRSRPRHAEDVGDQPVPRHHRVPGGRPRRRRVLRATASCSTSRIRCTRSGSIRSSTRTSPTGTRRRSTTTARR